MVSHHQQLISIRRARLAAHQNFAGAFVDLNFTSFNSSRAYDIEFAQHFANVSHIFFCPASNTFDSFVHIFLDMMIYSNPSSIIGRAV
jgi:hypothetical protein